MHPKLPCRASCSSTSLMETRRYLYMCSCETTQSLTLVNNNKLPGSVKLVQIRCYNMERPYRSMIEVDKGPIENDCSLRIIVFDRPTPGMTRYLVKLAHKPTRCGMLTEYARTRPVAEFLTYDDWAEFWASYAPLPGMKMYYVRYTHSPYRSLITTEAKVGAIWRPHFAFFAYEGVKLTCRVSADGERYGLLSHFVFGTYCTL